MKICLFSDIHGNRYAFTVALPQIKKICADINIFLGDIAGDGQHHPVRYRRGAAGQRQGQGGLPGQAQAVIPLRELRRRSSRFWIAIPNACAYNRPYGTLNLGRLLWRTKTPGWPGGRGSARSLRWATIRTGPAACTTWSTLWPFSST